jgi:hypothetical protein
MYKEADAWVAQCVEYDIGAQAPDQETLIQRMAAVINLEAETSIEMTGELFSGIPASPKKFEQIWSNCAASAESKEIAREDGEKIDINFALCA